MEQTTTSNSLLVSREISDALPSMVKNELTKLSAMRQEEFVEEFNRKKKSINVAYVLSVVGLFFFCPYYAYLRKWGLWVLFLLSGGGLMIWWLIDLFRMKSIVDDYNKDVAIEIMRNMKATSH